MKKFYDVSPEGGSGGFEVVTKSIKELGEAQTKQIGEVKDSLKAAKDELQNEISAAKAEAQKATEAVAEVKSTVAIIKSLGDNQGAPVTVHSQVQKHLNEKKTDIAALKGNKGASVNFDIEIKAAANMTTANYSGGTVGLTTWDPGFAQVPRRSPFLRQLVTVRPISSRYVAWAEQANRDGGAGNTAEGAAKTPADFDMVEANKIVEKITSYTKVSKEALDDISFLQSEINNDLISLVDVKLDTDLYGGSGTTPVIKGITTYATTFSVAGTGLSLAVNNATEFDVLRAAMWQVENAYFRPNYIILNPIDVALMDMLKDTTNQYIQAGNASQWPVKMFMGLPVISNNVVTAGTFLVGDFTKSNLAIREGINISVGYDADDFTKNLVTILAEVRAAHYIKSNHTAAFVKGTFSTAKAALETA